MNWFNILKMGFFENFWDRNRDNSLTEDEKMTFEILQDHMFGKYASSKLRPIFDIKHKYPELQPEIGRKAYRGVNIRASFPEFGTKEYVELFKNKLEMGEKVMQLQYQPHSEFTSWSYNESVGYFFADESRGEDLEETTGVLLETIVDDGFIFNDSFGDKVLLGIMLEIHPEMYTGPDTEQQEVICGKDIIDVTINLDLALESAYQLYGSKLTDEDEQKVLEEDE